MAETDHAGSQGDTNRGIRDTWDNSMTSDRGTRDLSHFLSAASAPSAAAIIVSLLQEQTGFDYGTTGTLLALMNIGNLLAGFATGALPGRLGMKRTVMILTAGYAIGYLMSAYPVGRAVAGPSSWPAWERGARSTPAPSWWAITVKTGRRE